MSATNPVLSNGALSYAIGRHMVITFPINITAGVPTFKGTEQPNMLIEKGLAGSQAILTQAKIDTLLGSTNEVLATTAFGTTAMTANDTLGFVVDCDGQIDRVDLVESFIDIGAAGAIPGIGFGSKTALTDATFVNPDCFVTANGNIAVRVNYTNITAVGTAGIACVKLHVILK